MLVSPYEGHPKSGWKELTQKLMEEFPLSYQILISVVESAWEDIFSSSIGNSGLKIGQDIFLPAQAIGVLLERLIIINLSNLDSRWRGSQSKDEKDVMCTFNEQYSFEIKTSSSSSGLYGNRSTSHRSQKRTKHRTGYYLVVNYKLPKEDDLSRTIRKIRFGWIDDEDWMGQDKPTGQQASIGAAQASLKLITLKKN